MLLIHLIFQSLRVLMGHVLFVFTEWRYGAVMCKISPYLQAVSVCASVNTLAAIAVDR